MDESEEEQKVVLPYEDQSEEGVKARPVRFAPLSEGGVSKKENSLGLLEGVTAKVAVELGRAILPVRDVLSLSPGSVVELDRFSTEPIDILVNGELVARGEVIVLDNDFGVRVTEIVKKYAGK